MEIKQVAEEVQATKEVTKATYTSADIERLIMEDLRSRGHTAGGVTFHTDYSIKADEWGMNRHTVTSFAGATAEIV